jgi:Uma2 family endonuclease
MGILMSSVISAFEPSTLPQDLPARITVGQFHAMIDAGVFAEDEGFELLEGWLFHKIAKKATHSITTRKLRKRLETLLTPEWDVDSQEPVTTLDSEPEPDVSVVRAGARDNKKRHPRPKEVGAIFEVSDGTLVRDRGTKKRLYARARIPVYWIVNLIDQQIEVYSGPTGPGKLPTYRTNEVYQPGEVVPLVLEGKEIARIDVDDILP